MKKNGNRNGRRKCKGKKDIEYRRVRERWIRQGGNDDENAEDLRDRLSVRGHG